ncbi:MAG: hypothetical protein C4297_09945 [Gemmataceae bacterium]
MVQEPCTRRVIGLAMASTGHAIKAALVEVAGQALDLSLRVCHSQVFPCPTDIRQFFHDARQQMLATQRVAIVHRAIGQALADAACQIADQASQSLHDLFCIGCLQPYLDAETEDGTQCHLALGDPGLIAEQTGTAVVADLIVHDPHGGYMPVLALWPLFHAAEGPTLLLHLGTAFQAVYIPPEPGPDALGAVTSPGMALVDALVRTLSGGREECDAGGRFAVQGRYVPDVAEQIRSYAVSSTRMAGLALSAAAERLAKHLTAQTQLHAWQAHDLLCTATHCAVERFADKLRELLAGRQPPARVVLSGGGMRNGFVLRLLQNRLRDCLDGPWMPCTALGVGTDVLRSVCAGILAVLFLDGVPAHLHPQPGCRFPRLLGCIWPGSPQQWVRCLAWMNGDLEALEALDE